MSTALARRLVEQAALPYRGRGLGFDALHYYHFARGKLGMDPIYLAILERQYITDGARVVDLGCGQLLLAPLLRSARQLYDSGDWFSGWPPPPNNVQIHGIELRPSVVAAAQRSLGTMATIECGDLRYASIPTNDVTVMMDVIHYLDPSSQLALLARIRDSLPVDGLFITRVANTQAGMSYWVTRIGDQLITLLRSAMALEPSWPKFHVRSLEEWRALLEHVGFAVNMRSMSTGTPFANVMIEARRTKPVLITTERIKA
jgi:SAM-dependent methyltransferase